MLRLMLFFALFLQTPPVSITSPRSGGILRGPVEILGTMDVQNFASAELVFGFASDSAGSWFTIQTYSQPKVDAPLAIWDTSSVTDGDYNLRLRVLAQDGSFQDVVVTGLRIRNDSPEPTATSLVEFAPPTSALAVTPVPPTPTLLSFPQPTALPSNPAALTIPLVYSTFGRGALIALVLFVVFSFILRFRRD